MKKNKTERAGHMLELLSKLPRLADDLRASALSLSEMLDPINKVDSPFGNGEASVKMLSMVFATAVDYIADIQIMAAHASGEMNFIHDELTGFIKDAIKETQIKE